jgi:hypothetical protein
MPNIISTEKFLRMGKKNEQLSADDANDLVIQPEKKKIRTKPGSMPYVLPSQRLAEGFKQLNRQSKPPRIDRLNRRN